MSTRFVKGTSGENKNCLGVLSYENQSPSFSTNSQLPDLLKISAVVAVVRRRKMIMTRMVIISKCLWLVFVGEGFYSLVYGRWYVWNMRVVRVKYERSTWEIRRVITWPKCSPAQNFRHICSFKSPRQLVMKNKWSKWPKAFVQHLMQKYRKRKYLGCSNQPLIHNHDVKMHWLYSIRKYYQLERESF